MVTTWTNIAENSSSWTDVPKPVAGTSTTISAGEPIGMLLGITYSDASSISSDIWTYVPKAD